MQSIYAWLVVNGFVRSEKFEQIFEWLVQAAKKQGCNLEVRHNTQLLAQFALGEGCKMPEIRMPQFVIFWDKDIRLARLLEKRGLRLFNCAQSIEICDDKARTFLELPDNEVKMPKTLIAPKTFRPEGFLELDFLNEIEYKLNYPIVIKECYGSFGQQVYLVHNRQEARECLRKVKNRPCLFQEYIASSAGRDLRIQMVGDQPVAAMYRYHTRDFRANVTNGGNMKSYTPNQEQVALAQKVMRLLHLDFAGIDLMFDTDGSPILCEVNSNAHFINMHQCTGINAADNIVSYCIAHAKI